MRIFKQLICYYYENILVIHRYIYNIYLNMLVVFVIECVIIYQYTEKPVIGKMNYLLLHE